MAFVPEVFYVVNLTQMTIWVTSINYNEMIENEEGGSQGDFPK